MYNVTDSYIEQIGIAGKEKDTKIIIGDTEIIPQTFKHSFSGDIFTSIMQKIEFEVRNGFVLEEGIEIIPKQGLKIDNEYEYIDYSNYNVYSSEINYDTGIVKTVAYDNLIKFMKKYKLSDLEIIFPTTILGLMQSICNYIGVDLYSTDFFNANLSIDIDLFTALNCTYRDVIDYVCQATLTTAIIKDNKLYFKRVTETNKILGPQVLKKFRLKQQFGGCNSLVLGRGDINDNVYSKDDSMIEQDGLQEIRFDNNEILDKRREELIDLMFSQIRGLNYYSFETKDLGIGIFEPADFCIMQELDGNVYRVLILNQSLTITSGCEGTMSANVPSDSTTKYQYATDSQKRQSKTEIIVDKQNQKIEATVSKVDEQNEKIASLIIKTGEIEGKISDATDTTITEESNTAKVTLEGINASEPVTIKINPLGTSISYLYPRDNLYPSDDLFMPDRIIRFKNKTTNEVFNYELPTDLLYYDSDTYDEFYLDYAQKVCKVDKKVGYNTDGSVYKLSTPYTSNFDYPTIELTDGDYEVSLPGYSNAYLYVRLMSKNIYTEQFVTRVESSTQIRQTVNEIDLKVNQKLTNYSTTVQMNSAIALKANEITSTVSQTYETKSNATSKYSEIKQTTDNITSTVSTKVGNNEIISKINQSSEAVTINANKISLAGKTINLTSDNIAINSTNFKVDKNGNMTCNNATVKGTINATSGTFENCTIKNNCTIPASTVSGTLSTSNIPNLSASKITSGTISTSRLSSSVITTSNLSAQSINANQISGGVITCGGFRTGSSTDTNLVAVPGSGTYVRRIWSLGAYDRNGTERTGITDAIQVKASLTTDIYLYFAHGICYGWDVV